MIAAASKLNLKQKLDNDLFNHIVYVSNQILMMSKKEGLSPDMREKSGKMLWRLFWVVQAYNEKNKEASLQGALNLVLEVKDVFGLKT